MSQCAHRLGMAFAAEAQRSEAIERRLEYFQLFERCFFAVPVATALRLRLRRAPAAWPMPAAQGRPSDSPEREGSEREGLERETAERADQERDREVERATLPILLRTLEGVAADASRLPGSQPAALPALRQLLASVRAPSAPPRRSGEGLRARLAGSATFQTLTVPPAASQRPGGSPPGFASRPTTGPPPRY